MSQDEPTPPEKGFGMRPFLTTLLIILTVIAFGPLVSALIADVLADLFSCETFDTGVRNCSGIGASLESLITFMMGLGWLLLLTFPLMALALILWPIWLLFAWRARRNRVS